MAGGKGPAADGGGAGASPRRDRARRGRGRPACIARLSGRGVRRDPQRLRDRRSRRPARADRRVLRAHRRRRRAAAPAAKPTGVEACHGRLCARRHGLAPRRPGTARGPRRPERRRARGRVPQPRPHRAGGGDRAARHRRSRAAGAPGRGDARAPRRRAVRRSAAARADAAPGAARARVLRRARRIPRRGGGRGRAPRTPPRHCCRGPGRDGGCARTARRGRGEGRAHRGARRPRPVGARGSARALGQIGGQSALDALVRVARTDEFEPATAAAEAAAAIDPPFVIRAAAEPDAGRHLHEAADVAAL